MHAHARRPVHGPVTNPVAVAVRAPRGEKAQLAAAAAPHAEDAQTVTAHRGVTEVIVGAGVQLHAEGGLAVAVLPDDGGLAVAVAAPVGSDVKFNIAV